LPFNPTPGSTNACQFSRRPPVPGMEPAQIMLEDFPMKGIRGTPEGWEKVFRRKIQHSPPY
jgi:hypothetical protein